MLLCLLCIKIWSFICTNSRIKRHRSIRPPYFYDGVVQHSVLVCFVFPSEFCECEMEQCELFSSSCDSSTAVLLSRSLNPVRESQGQFWNLETWMATVSQSSESPLGGLLLRDFKSRARIPHGKSSGFSTLTVAGLTIDWQNGILAGKKAMTVAR